MVRRLSWGLLNWSKSIHFGRRINPILKKVPTARAFVAVSCTYISIFTRLLTDRQITFPVVNDHQGFVPFDLSFPLSLDLPPEFSLDPIQSLFLSLPFLSLKQFWFLRCLFGVLLNFLHQFNELEAKYFVLRYSNLIPLFFLVLLLRREHNFNLLWRGLNFFNNGLMFLLFLSPLLSELEI